MQETISYIKIVKSYFRKSFEKQKFKRKAKTKMVLQVHDELLFDPNKDELAPVIKNLMETALHLNVPVIVDFGTGNNWLDVH